MAKNSDLKHLLALAMLGGISAYVGAGSAVPPTLPGLLLGSLVGYLMLMMWGGYERNLAKDAKTDLQLGVLSIATASLFLLMAATQLTVCSAQLSAALSQSKGLRDHLPLRPEGVSVALTLLFVGIGRATARPATFLSLAVSNAIVALVATGLGVGGPAFTCFMQAVASVMLIGLSTNLSWKAIQQVLVTDTPSSDPMVAA